LSFGGRFLDLATRVDERSVRNGTQMHRDKTLYTEAEDATTGAGDDPATALAIPSNFLAGAFLGSLIGAIGVILAQAAHTDLIATGAAILGSLGVVHGLGAVIARRQISDRGDPDVLFTRP
jgi:hypothetical protein